VKSDGFEECCIRRLAISIECLDYWDGRTSVSATSMLYIFEYSRDYRVSHPCHLCRKVGVEVCVSLGGFEVCRDKIEE
jgi:hypothetical protein